MEVSIYLAKFIGMYLMVAGFALIVHAKDLRPTLIELVKSPALYMLSAFMALLFGSYVIAVHNVWVTDWPVLITILGWLGLVKGMMRILLPDESLKMVAACLENKALYTVLISIVFLLGSFLVYMGYLHHLS